MSLALVPSLYYKKGIDLKTVANHTIVDAQSGKRFVAVGGITIITKTKTGSGTGAQISIGTNSGSSAYDNVMDDTTLPADMAVNDTHGLSVGPAGEPTYNPTFDISTTPIVLRVQVASGATTETCDVYIFGHIEP